MFADFARSIDLRADFMMLGCITVAIVLLAFALWRNHRLASARWQMTIVLVVAAVVAGLAWYTNTVWRPVAEGIEIPVWCWAAFFLVVMVLTLATLGRRSRAEKHGSRSLFRGIARAFQSLVFIGLALLCTLAGVNAFYGGYPTLASALKITVHTETLASLELTHQQKTFDAGGQPLENVWQEPSSLPDSGSVVTESIPASDSTFKPRNSYIYLPPAYFADERPLLPIVVMMAGQPGSPGDWFNMGGLNSIMDEYATNHGGLAPIVVVVDQLSGDWTNPLCSDTSHGKVATYLQEDVPQWIKTNLQTDTQHSHWAIGGLSNGGTCAMQVATRQPEIYPTFLDFSGEGAPSLGTLESTIAKGFDGDETTYKANNPIDIMQKTSYADKNVAGIFTMGKQDNVTYRHNFHQVYETAKNAKMDVQWKEYEGKHERKVWEASMKDALPWLAQRTGLSS